MQLNFFTGTAAELIKLYPLIHLAHERGHKVRVISSGQSRENFMMQYRDFGLPESELVWLLASDGDLQNAGSALRWFLRAVFTRKSAFHAKALREDGKSFLIVHGDTLSTLAGAWLGTRAGLPVVHIEAGLRSARLFNPFPEEITRRLVSRLAHVHMAPDGAAEANLRQAGVKGWIVNTGGNTLLDAVLLSAKFAKAKAPAEAFALVNVHRFENLNSHARWHTIVDTVVQTAGKLRVIFVAHPQTRHKLDLDQESRERFMRAGVEIRERMTFGAFISLLKRSEFLISDGGSNQEECSYLGKPCLLMRESSERLEGLETCCVLSRFDQKVISEFLADVQRRVRPADFSTARPSAKILDSLDSFPTR